MLRAAAERTEERALACLGRDLGTVHRDEIVAAGLIAALRQMADNIDRGPSVPLPPRVYSALVREWADDLEAEVGSA